MSRKLKEKLEDNRRRKRKPYGKLIRRLVFQLCVVVALSAAAVVLLREAVRGHMGNWIVNGTARLLNVDWLDAWWIYHRVFVNHMDVIIGGAILLVFVILFRVTRAWFTRYFDQMVEGVDQLAAESQEDIHMCPELGFMEEKLNEVKHRLRKRTQEARAAEQRKNELVVYLAHDIKTPLTSVIGYLSLLREAPQIPESQKEDYIRIALDKAYRLEGLINELFEITRYNLRDIPLHMEQIDFCYMMVQIVDELYPQLSANGNTVEQKIPEDMVIFGDSEKLARVFNNILKNAATYGRPDSRILIEAKKEGERILVSIENEGEIPQNELGSIFEKFYRLDSARSTSTGGAGLGLAIARDIVARHGGTVKAESGEGKTIFQVELPSGSPQQPEQLAGSPG